MYGRAWIDVRHFGCLHATHLQTTWYSVGVDRGAGLEVIVVFQALQCAVFIGNGFYDIFPCAGESDGTIVHGGVLCIYELAIFFECVECHFTQIAFICSSGTCSYVKSYRYTDFLTVARLDVLFIGTSGEAESQKGKEEEYLFLHNSLLS